MWKIIFTLLTPILTLAGCINTPSKSDIARPSPLSTNEFKYGRYCGAGYPAKPDYSIPAYDDIDEACKSHDKCYDEVGMNNAQCNDDLDKKVVFLAKNFTNMMNSSANDSSPQGLEKNTHAGMCLQLVTDIIGAFESLMTIDESQTLRTSIKKTIGLPLAIPAIVGYRIIGTVAQGFRQLNNLSDRPCNIE